jgi:hypothetical protein
MMHVDPNIATHVVFGWDPLWVSAILFVITYLVIVTETINRAIVSGLGAALMISLGVVNQEQAIAGVDFNTLGLLTGMMVIVAITRRCGIFQYVAIWSAKKVKASPWGILLMLSIVTAVFSALLDNVTTVLLIAPVTLLITEEMEINPYPFLFAEIFASNIGGASTLVGDPPNIVGHHDSYLHALGEEPARNCGSARTRNAFSRARGDNGRASAEEVNGSSYAGCNCFRSRAPVAARTGDDCNVWRRHSYVFE